MFKCWTKIIENLDEEDDLESRWHISLQESMGEILVKEIIEEPTRKIYQ
jgi:hypothetical protein